MKKFNLKNIALILVLVVLAIVQIYFNDYINTKSQKKNVSTASREIASRNNMSCTGYISSFFVDGVPGNSPLPNRLIRLGRSAREIIKKSLGRSYRHLKTLLKIDGNTHIHMAAMEFGTLEVGGHTFTAKVGGMAVVVNDMIKNLPKFLRSRGKGKVSFTFMAFEGVPKGKYVDDIVVEIAGRKEIMKRYRFDHPDGATIYFLDHPIFKRRSINNPSRNLYQPSTGHSLYSGREEWEAAYSYALFSRGIAKVHKRIGANVYHAHDYHVGLAGMWLKKDSVVSMTIHNAGPGYRGEFWTRNYGHYRAFHPDYPYGVPAGDYRANDHLLSILGIDFNTYMRYFEHDGQFNTMKGLTKFFHEHNLVGGVPVSNGYAREVGNDFIFEHTLFDGIENGLSDVAHAKNHVGLSRLSREELENMDPIIANRVRRNWLEGLNFGEDLESPEGIARVHQTHDKLKAMLQENAGLEVNPNKVVFSLVTRIVDQKNIGIFVENIRRIVAHGGQVIILGKAGDAAGEAIVRRLRELAKLPELAGQFRFYDAFANIDARAMITAGGDVFPITSKFEPCGLTDIEAAWLGNVPFTVRTGGLGKVKNSFTYTRPAQRSDEIRIFGEKAKEIINLFRENPEEFKRMRIGAMGEDFSWAIAFSRYYENYRSSALFKIVKDLNDKVANEGISLKRAEKIIKRILDYLPSDLVENFQRLLAHKHHKSSLERYIIKYSRK